MTEPADARQPAGGHGVAGQPDTGSAPRPQRRRATGRDRRHLTPGRPRQVKIRYTDGEYSDVAAAAATAGLTPTGYAAEAALAAARDTTPPSTAPWRQALIELMAARGQVRRFGSNVNQAARTLHALGEAPDWLDRAVAITERAVTRLDEAASTVVAVARADRTGGNRQRAVPPATYGGQTAGTVRCADSQAMADSDDSRQAEHQVVSVANRAVVEGAA